MCSSPTPHPKPPLYMIAFKILDVLLYSSVHTLSPPGAHRSGVSLQLLHAVVTVTAFTGLQPDIQTMPPFPPELQVRQNRN